MQQNAIDEEGFDKILLKELSDEFHKGKNEGKIEGKNEGKIEGKFEGLIETAKKMKLAGMATLQIAQFTGLTESDIENLE